MTKQAYTVHDVIAAECNLEPMVCLYCGSNEVTYHQYIGDASCGDCGKWQLNPEEEVLTDGLSNSINQGNYESP